MALLQVNNLKKGFGGTDVLKGVSFSLEKGQVLAIIGSSGSGKTTLLRCLNFLETPDKGRILVNGEKPVGRITVSRFEIAVKRIFPAAGIVPFDSGSRHFYIVGKKPFIVIVYI